MKGRRTTLTPCLSPADMATLLALSRSQQRPHALVRRAQCLLAVAQGESLSATAKRYGITRQHVAKWLRRYRDGGIAALEDRRRGRPRRAKND